MPPDVASLRSSPHTVLPAALSSCRAVGTDSDEQAELLWLGRAVAMPDAWRARATSAAGLLSAAAAATLAALVLRSDHVSTLVTVLLLLAGAGYACAVIAYLVGAVWPEPKGKPKDTLRVANEIWHYCTKETKPIRRAVIVGTVLAVIAVAATGAALVVTVVTSTDEPSESAHVTLTREAPAELKSACPDLPNDFEAQIEDMSDSRVVLHVEKGVCGDREAEIVVSRASVVILYRH